MGALVEVPPGAAVQRYFVTYSGIGLPLRLVQPIAPDQIANRNTYIRAWFDDEDRLAGFEKLVYGEVEMTHRYHYDAQGTLDRAEVSMGGDAPTILVFEDTARAETGA